MYKITQPLFLLFLLWSSSTIAISTNHTETKSGSSYTCSGSIDQCRLFITQGRILSGPNTTFEYIGNNISSAATIRINGIEYKLSNIDVNFHIRDTQHTLVLKRGAEILLNETASTQDVLIYNSGIENGPISYNRFFKNSEYLPICTSKIDLTGKYISASQGCLADTYCKDNSTTYPPCDDDFKNKCSGSVSGLQGWGGKTCFTTSGGTAPE